MTRPDNTDAKSWPIRIVSAGSLIWLFICVWLLFSAKPCDAIASDWFSRRVSCMPLNEIGDALAGAFSPLAFIWLAAAVFLQRAELAAQRQELKESRSVATQQVEEARRNVELIGEQTTLLKEDRLRIQQREVDEDIDEMVSILVDELRKNVNQTYINERAPAPDYSGNMVYDTVISVSQSNDDYEEIERYADGVRSLLTQAQIFAEDEVEFFHSGTYFYADAIRIIGQIKALASAASPPKRALLNTKGFDRLSRFMPALVATIQKHGRKDADDDIPF